MAAELRRRILLMCKRSYWNQLEEGMIGRAAVKYLRAVSGAALQDEAAPLAEWATLSECAPPPAESRAESRAARRRRRTGRLRRRC